MTIELIAKTAQGIHTIKWPKKTVYVMNTARFKKSFNGIKTRIFSQRNQKRIWSEHLFLIIKNNLSPAMKSPLPNIIEVNKSNELPIDALSNILARPDRGEFVISMNLDHENKLISLLRGSLDSLLVPFDAFPKTATGQTPDFEDAEIIDYGRTIRFGDYEAGVDSILYDYDRDYRKELNKQRSETDKTLGACLRRVRLAQKLKQSDFSGVSAKEVGRIERNITQNPHTKTLRAILDQLGLENKSELLTY